MNPRQMQIILYSTKVGYSPDYVFLLQYITRMAESSAPTTISVAPRSVVPSHQRRAPRKSVTALIMFFFCSTSRGWPCRQHQPPYPWRRGPWCRAISAEANTLGRVITINHHYYRAEPSVPRPTPWAKPSILTSPQHPYPWAHPSALATAVQLAHLSEILIISNGPIIGWPISHGTLSTSAVR